MHICQERAFLLQMVEKHTTRLESTLALCSDHVLPRVVNGDFYGHDALDAQVQPSDLLS